MANFGNIFFSSFFLVEKEESRSELVKLRTAIARVNLGLTFEETFIAIANWAYHASASRPLKREIVEFV